ncbi:DedA family protein [Paenibacillus sp. LMG 31460]|uniref:DedA family protein n=1 Tax=Paenibacillus germinis TaxID=2654979 RepID=A0ABX1YYZ2_9BACL|nr:DedA family protein [Paenibacillus germinis]NOU86353.1 DedA family protein [Paenibacillus germinis]
MISNLLIELIQDHGYIIFFLAFCLGPFGIPIPNEISILTGGLLANNGVFNPWIIYGFILSGLLTSTTVGFFIGKFFGNWILGLLGRQKRYIFRAEALFTKYGNFAICLGYLIPVIRYVMPIIAGISGKSFKKFALLSYTSAVIWTGLFFTIGFVFGDRISRLLSLIDFRSIGVALVIAAIVICIYKLQKLLNSELMNRSLMNEDINK